MDIDAISQLIDAKIAKALSDTQYNFAPIPYHQHTGIDAPNIDPANLLGFPVMPAAPTDMPLEGTVRLYNVSGTRKIYAFLSGVWYSATLT